MLQAGCGLALRLPPLHEADVLGVGGDEAVRGTLKRAADQVLVAHTCNPSYSGDRDQEDHGSKPPQANSSQGPILKIPITKRAGRVVQGGGPEFKPLYRKKKKKERERKPRPPGLHVRGALRLLVPLIPCQSHFPPSNPPQPLPPHAHIGSICISRPNPASLLAVGALAGIRGAPTDKQSVT
jgi:hypothetical protein